MSDRIMDTIRKSCLVVFLSYLGTHPLGAEEIPEHFVPVGPIGMGGAYTAIANDESAIWANPAGIARVRKARKRSSLHLIKFPNIIAGANTSSRSFYNGFQAASEKNVEQVIAETEDLGDKPFWARAGLFPVAMFDITRGSPAAFGIFSNTTAKAIIESDTPEEARIEAVSDAGATISFAYTNRTNRFNVGLTLRPTLRYAYEDRIPSEALLDKDGMKQRLENDANNSQGNGIDFGAMWTLADFWFPTIGFAVLNLPTGCKENYLNPFTEKLETVCGNVYSGDIGNEYALSIVDPTDVRVGLSITPRLARKMALRFALDAHHLPISSGTTHYGLQGIEASKLVHAGLELFFGNPLTIPPLAIRTGYNQGFATVGAALNANFFSLAVSTYGVDVSSTAKAVEDRRTLVSLSVDI